MNAASANDTTPVTARAKRGETFEISCHDITGSRNNDGKAIVTPGESIVLHGAVAPGRRYVKGPDGKHTMTNARPILYAVPFKVGDEAAYGGMNLTYTGTIVAIGPKTVTIEEPYSSHRKHRLTFDYFHFYNWDFDAAEVAKRSAEWRD